DFFATPWNTLRVFELRLVAHSFVPCATARAASISPPTHADTRPGRGDASSRRAAFGSRGRARREVSGERPPVRAARQPASARALRSHLAARARRRRRGV